MTTQQINNTRLLQIEYSLFAAAKQHPLYENIIKTNGNVVIRRGSDNPEYLFIGEAPGFTENQKGQPFIGKSGKVIDEWIEQTIPNSDYAIINAVPIIPLSSEGKIRPPSEEEIEYFQPHIVELINTLNPRFIVCVGKSAARCLTKQFRLCGWEDNIGFIYHPAYYLRNGKTGLDDFKKLIETKDKFLYIDGKEKQMKLI